MDRTKSLAHDTREVGQPPVITRALLSRLAAAEDAGERRANFAAPVELAVQVRV
jgi:hypothetical protein